MNTYKIFTIFLMYMAMTLVMSALLGSIIGITGAIATWIILGTEHMLFIGITAGVVTFLCGCCIGLFMSLSQTIEDIKEERMKEYENHETI